MYIVKEKDEDKINKVAEIVGEKSKKLADTMKQILALTGQRRLNVEIIEQAIDVVDGKKKLVDLIRCKLPPSFIPIRTQQEKTPIDFLTWVAPFDDQLHDRDVQIINFTNWDICVGGWNPLRNISEFRMLERHGHAMISALVASEGKEYIKQARDYDFNSHVLNFPSAVRERGMLVVRNR